MKIEALNFYPIKALRPIPLQSATLTPQGILHDRTYMLFKVNPDSSLRKLQLSAFPQCALFSQKLVSSASDDKDDSSQTILVTYNIPSPPVVPHHPLQSTTLSVPLAPPSPSALAPVSIDLHGSPADALRMGDPYDAFFSACFGFPTILVHIGAGRRPVLGTLAPPSHQQQEQQPSLLSSLTSYFTPSLAAPPPSSADTWLTFTDCAPYLITSTSSLSHPSLAALVSSLPQDDPLMPKFRPNIVVSDPEEAPFAEDFWAELALPSSTGAKLLLTANCGRCSSLNVNYALGRPAPGPEGKLLNTLMKNRRVDPGHKYAPVFGRYAFLSVPGASDGVPPRVCVRVGDDITVTHRNTERTVFDWPSLAAPKKTAAAA